MRNYFHLHLVSDSTGETLIAVSRAATAQYEGTSAIEHVYPLIRTEAHIERAISEIEVEPGIVLYTLVDPILSERLEQACKAIGSPCLSVLNPVLNLFQSYLGVTFAPRPGAQHVLNAEYFKRIDALNFTMMHDDGVLPEKLHDAEIILVGVSRTSKTPTGIYLANRGFKTANFPIVPGIPLPQELEKTTPNNTNAPLIVGLIATPDRIVQIRQNRLLSLNASDESDYVDRQSVADEIANSRRVFSRNNWPIIDVTRRSIEETAAAIIDLHKKHRLSQLAR